MKAAALEKVATTGAERLLADVHALDVHDSDEREPALIRLEAVLGREFADRLVAALSNERSGRSN